MFLLLVLTVLIFMPLKVEFSGRIHNFEFETRLKAVFLYSLPISVSIFNLRDEPLKLRYRFLGKTYDIEALLKENKKKKKIKRSKDKENNKNTKGIARFALSLTKYIKLLEFVGRIGIKDRADTTAILTGCLNGTFYPGAKMSSIKKTKVYFIPQYNMDVFHVDYKCIISISAANIIHESIRYFMKRRK